jgi:NADP-dependent 3-hydroxy acid dehydrogenase YdfG
MARISIESPRSVAGDGFSVSTCDVARGVSRPELLEGLPDPAQVAALVTGVFATATCGKAPFNDRETAIQAMTALRDGGVVVVTGASAGVGRATAVAFGRRGAQVALLARANPGLEAAAEEIERAGGRALAIPTDVADAAQVEEAAERVESELGPIDVWVNDAMATIFARAWDIEPDEITRATEVTYLGAVHGTMAALRRMRPRGQGTVVQVGSALAYRAIPLQAAYCGAKHALRGFTDSVRCELMSERSGVWITMVHLPGLNTPQFTWVRVRGLSHTPRPVAPVYQPEVAAEAVVWAAGRRRREVWVGGSTVATILGNKLVPKLADLYLARTNIRAQQTDQPVAPDRSDYLFEPVDEDRGPHGPFGSEAKGRSWQLEASKHRGLLLGAGAAAAAAVLRR